MIIINLLKYYGKQVQIACTSGNVYEGIVGDYCYPEDDENNQEMIVLDVQKKNGRATTMNPLGLYSKDIHSIRVIL